MASTVTKANTTTLEWLGGSVASIERGEPQKAWPICAFCDRPWAGDHPSSPRSRESDLGGSFPNRFN
jgi:hypothetical protein